MMLIAQISDTHIKAGRATAYQGRVDTASALERCIASLLALDPRPDVVLLTGDLVDSGRAEDYAALLPLLAPLPMPLYPLPGNHDGRAAFRAAFPGLPLPASGPLAYVIEDHPIRLIMLDSTIEGQSGGELGSEQCAWLDRTLSAAPTRPTIVALHHPPFLTRIGHMDDLTLRDRAAFAAVLKRHPQVERVLCGHLHRPIQALVGGRLAMTAPGTAHQVALDLRPDGPSAFRLEPPGFLLHHWHEQDGLVSHYGVIGDFAGPYPFFDDSGELLD